MLNGSGLDAVSQLARTKLETVVERGKQRARGVMEYVHTHVPEDAIARGKALEWGFAPLVAEGAVPALVMQVGEAPRAVHNHALTQLAGKAGVPSKYLAELVRSPNDHLRHLGVEILRTHYHDTEAAGGRYLVRSVGQQVRGFLSDRYRRLDNRPLLDAFAAACQDVGAVPTDGTVSDVRIQVKAMLPEIVEPVPGEVMVLGVTWGNSDFGAAAYTMSMSVLRLICLNGATMEDVLRNVHLGRRLDHDISYSNRTYALDTAATVSATKDTVRALFSAERRERLVAGIRAAHEQQVEWTRWSRGLGSLLTKAESALAETLFEAADVTILPQGNSLWRASNVLSWLAEQTQDTEHRMDLERAAGAAIEHVMPKAA